MKTLTITLHDTDNCGSSLQAFALQHFLLKNHIENEIIDYVPSYTQNNGNPLRTFIRKIVFFWPSYIRKKKFKQFIREHVKITKKKYTNYKELEQNLKKEKTLELKLGGDTKRVRFFPNPQRTISTMAQTDSQSIQERPCFL